MLTPDQRRTFSNVVRMLPSTIPYEDMQSRFAMDRQSEALGIPDGQARVFAKQIWELNPSMNLTPQQFVGYFSGFKGAYRSNLLTENLHNRRALPLVACHHSIG